ncbi:outer dynein arm-docking complex subunit 4-like [Babylonia areolata]|uniref:outer dynein arm-docking complex subunit 4-like n=1 Tax=Babylonia areolata TaxID=304850 RepID=UPI003FCF9D01
MSSSSDEPEEDFTVLRTQAAMLQRKHQYERSFKMYSRALNIRVNEDRCLVARSKCYLAMGDTDRSLADAETMLRADKTFHRALLRKAEAMYHKGNFEMALVFYHRGKRLRPDVHEFALGIQKARNAIENSVGTPERVKLNTSGDLSFFEEKPVKKSKLPQRGQSIVTAGGQQKTGQKRQPATRAQRKTIHQLLGELYHDRQYLENLLLVTDESTAFGKTMSGLADGGLSYLDTRTNFWRQQNPIYSMAYQKRAFKERFGRKEVLTKDQILTSLEKIDEAQSTGRYKTALSRATKCLHLVKSKAESQVINKQALIGQLHSCIGNAHLELSQFERALSHHMEDLRIGRKFDIVEGVSRSTNNIGRIHFRQGEYEKAIHAWESKMDLLKSGQETMWMCHELGRCYLELGKASDALYYASKSMDEADYDGNAEWQLQSSVLAGQCEVKMYNLPSAEYYFQKALELSIKLEQAPAPSHSEGFCQQATEDVPVPSPSQGLNQQATEEAPAPSPSEGFSQPATENDAAVGGNEDNGHDPGNEEREGGEEGGP